MQHFSRVLIFLVFGFFFSFSSCKKSSKTEPDLTSLNLLRGDVLLCGDGKFGDVSFTEACGYQTRENFNLAVSLLHSFEYLEAEKMFVQVIDKDPECAMAYWGVAMSIYHGLWAPPDESVLEKGNQLLLIAENLPKSEKAERYLNAIGAFYTDWKTESDLIRKQRYADQMEAMYRDFPNDTEVAVFYALARRASASPSDTTYSRQREAGEILDNLFQKNPNHPGIAHYIIHSYDYPKLAGLGLDTARRYADIAPSSAHAQHMPSHIFTRLGLWDESIKTNINSASSAVCYAESMSPGAHWDEEIHAMGYLVYAYLQTGNNLLAQEQLDYLQTFERVFPPNFKVAYTAAAIPSRIAVENKNWKRAAALEFPVIGGFNWKDFPWERSVLYFARALGNLNIENFDATQKELDLLLSARAELEILKDSYKANQVDIQIKIIEAWVEFKKGDKKEAIKLMKVAAEMENLTSKHPVTPGEIVPADELLGDMLLLVKSPKDALAVYEDNLKKRPNRFNGIFGAAMAAKESGDLGKASFYFQSLLEQTRESNSQRPEIVLATNFLQQNPL